MTLAPNSKWRIGAGGEETSALFEAAKDSRAVFVAGHGAGSHKDHRSMLELSGVLTRHGFDVVRFNFDYRERGSRMPDRMPKLQSCFWSVVELVRSEGILANKKLVIGGRSMGGRVASMLAADGFACDGLLLLAYPLHPAGKPDKLRDAHLPKIRVPVLCINGTRDALCSRQQMLKSIQGLRWDMHWLEGAGHSFPVTDELGALAGRWLERL